MTSSSSPPLAATPEHGRAPLRRRWSMTHYMSLGFTCLTIAAMASMLVLFIVQSLPVWTHSGTDYLTGTKWFFRDKQFGAAPMIYGTVVVSTIALLLAAPIGIGSAIFTAEYLPGRLRLLLKLTIELLAGIPSIVYGLLGILFLRGYVTELFQSLGVDMLYGGDSLLTAGILLGVMILPTVMTFSDDALRCVPAGQRHAARGLGLTHAQMVLSVSLPQARKGLVAALLLALGRALGETIAVFLVVGKQDNQWPTHLFSFDALISPGQTITSKLGGSETPDGYGSPLLWAAIVGLGLLLLVISGLVTLVGAWFEGRSDANA